MLDIKEYLKQTRTVLVTQDAFDELVRKASAQPEITDEQAIEHLQSTGWMQNHDREMYESGLRKQLADDSGSYDSLIPCEDTISRQAAIDAIYAEFEYVYCFNCDHEGNEEWCEDCHRKYMKWSASRNTIERVLNGLPSAEPEVLACGEGELSADLPSAQPEHTMEEFMYGQDMGNPEDGSL